MSFRIKAGNGKFHTMQLLEQIWLQILLSGRMNEGIGRLPGIIKPDFWTFRLFDFLTF